MALLNSGSLIRSVEPALFLSVESRDLWNERQLSGPINIYKGRYTVTIPLF